MPEIQTVSRLHESDFVCWGRWATVEGLSESFGELRRSSHVQWHHFHTYFFPLPFRSHTYIWWVERTSNKSLKRPLYARADVWCSHRFGTWMQPGKVISTLITLIVTILSLLKHCYSTHPGVTVEAGRVERENTYSVYMFKSLVVTKIFLNWCLWTLSRKIAIASLISGIDAPPQILTRFRSLQPSTCPPSDPDGKIMKSRW